VSLVDPAILTELAGFSTPSVANGIETFAVRGRHVGFADHRIQCRFPDLGPVVGFAATARIRAREDLPGTSRADLWRHVVSIPEPRVIVVEDLDEPGGVGSFWGEVNANIFRALGCTAVVTNGGVRDLPEMESLGFQAFSGTISVSHAYVRVVEIGQPVRVGGLEVRPGDVLHGDRHGVLSIPSSLASALPDAVRAVEAGEREIIDFCQSTAFSLDGLVELGRRHWPER
jgi:4-hydroxy-4-methyl-2-oxoglutarate aldolase